MKEMNISLVGGRTPVRLATETGTTEDWEIREMTAAARDSYLEALGPRMKTNEEGKVVGVSNYDGMQADLLVRCLFKKDGTAVTREVVQAWPSHAVSTLFKEAQRLNHFGSEDAEGEAKKG